MPTQLIRRVLFLVPDARKAAMVTWWMANVDASDTNLLSVGLSATGSAPATHWAACAALTDVQFKKVMQRLCNLASITPPANWDSMTRTEKRDWLRSQIVPIWQRAGIGIRVDDNDGTWDDYRAAVATAGLRFLQFLLSQG